MDAHVVASTVTAVASHTVQVLDSLNLILDKVDKILSSPVLGHIVMWLFALFGGGSGFKWLKNKQVERMAQLAFMATEEVARRTDNANIDKVAHFAEHFESMMKRSGWWGPLSESDRKHAQSIADALNLAYENAKALAQPAPAPAQAPAPDKAAIAQPPQKP